MLEICNDDVDPEECKSVPATSQSQIALSKLWLILDFKEKDSVNNYTIEFTVFNKNNNVLKARPCDEWNIRKHYQPIMK